MEQTEICGAILPRERAPACIEHRWVKPFVQFSPKQETIGVLSSKEKKSAEAGKAARSADLWATVGPQKKQKAWQLDLWQTARPVGPRWAHGAAAEQQKKAAAR